MIRFDSSTVFRVGAGMMAIGAIVTLGFYLWPNEREEIHPAKSAAPTDVAPTGQVGATGVPIDPNLKTVVVEVPTGSDAPIRKIDEQLKKLHQEQVVSEAKLKRQLTAYTQKVAVSTPEQKRDRVQAMTPEMDEYKRRSLEIFKLERQKEQRQVNQSNAAEVGSAR